MNDRKQKFIVDRSEKEIFPGAERIFREEWKTAMEMLVPNFSPNS
jgi:hypothetical protein